jgi:hypothetical protein
MVANLVRSNNSEIPELKEKLKSGGFEQTDDLIHLFVGGSKLYGTNINQHGTSLPNAVSDIDLYGVYIETPSQALGVSEETHFTGGTSDQYVRNKAGDEDYKCYTLKRWRGLLAPVIPRY